MAFKPNYGRDRAERARAARTRSEEKQLKKDEKTALRKARRAELDPAPDDRSRGGRRARAGPGRGAARLPDQGVGQRPAALGGAPGTGARGA